MMLIGCAPAKKIETMFYPMPPQQPRLQFLTAVTSEDDIGAKKSAFQTFLLGDIQFLKQMGRPYGIAAVKGKIYISDRTLKKIIIIDLEKNKFSFLESKKGGAVSQPAGIWTTEDGFKYIADFGRKQILVFDKNDEYVRAYGKKGQFERPLDVTVYENKIYVCDFVKNEIYVLDRDTGDIVMTLGGIGIAEGKMYKPTHVVVDKYGNLYVMDSFNYRVQKFNAEGKFIKQFGSQGDALGSFARPKGIAVDNEGLLYVADTAFENVQIFDAETADLLLFFGGFGSAPGNMYLPSGLAVDHQNVEYFSQYVDKDFQVQYLVYVGNMLGAHKLNIYGFGKWIGPPLPEM
jgi:DNA-binding beta-propeller fold protein YncE